MNYRHGKRHAPVYGVWAAMISRCTNRKTKQYRDYGGRGISVCPQWRDFRNFYADMGDPPPGHTLERDDNQRGYSLDNCRWATRSEQNRNRRNVRMLTAHGETLSMAAWAERSGLNLKTISQRLRNGWPTEAAVTQAVVKARKGVPRGVTFHDKQSTGAARDAAGGGESPKPAASAA